MYVIVIKLELIEFVKDRSAKSLPIKTLLTVKRKSLEKFILSVFLTVLEFYVTEFMICGYGQVK